MTGTNDVNAATKSAGDSEIRFFADAEQIAVLDGYCSATNCNRTDVMRQLLADFAAKELHKAKVICRVVGCNPTAADTDRRG